MASTPSASALSAVLRCRGNIWTRNPPNKRPAPSGYSLGLVGGTQRDLLTERTRSNRTSAREAFLQGDRVVVGRRLTVAYKADGNMKNCREMNQLGNKFVYPTGHAHSAAQSAPVRQVARRLILTLPGVETCSKVIQMIKCERCTDVCKLAFVQKPGVSPAAVLKVSMTSPSLMEDAGQTLKSTCLSVTALLSEMLLWWRPSISPEAPSQHLLCQQDEKIMKHNVLQANEHSSTDLTSSKDNSGCGQKVTEDRPD